MYQSLIITRDLERYSPELRYKRSDTRIPIVPSYGADTVQSRNRIDLLNKVQKHVPFEKLSRDQIGKMLQFQKAKVRNQLGYRNFPDIGSKRKADQQTQLDRLQNFMSQPDTPPKIRRRPILLDISDRDMIMEVLDYSPVRDYILKRKKSKIHQNKKKKTKERTLDQYKAKIKQAQNKIIIRIVNLYYRLYRLIAFSKCYAMGRRKQIEMTYGKISTVIDNLLNHYNLQLYYPLKFYRDIIKEHMDNPSKHYNDQALRFLNALILKLKNTGLPVELFNFFKSIALHRGYIPRNLLSRFQLKRINLSKIYGCLKEPTSEQSLMIIGNFICLRILCKRIMLQPWNIKTEQGLSVKKHFGEKKSKINSTNEHENNKILEEDFHKYRKIVINIASAFNSIFVRHFYKNVQTKNNKTLIRRHGYEAARSLNIFPQGYEEQLNLDEKQLGIGILSRLNKGYHKTLLKVDDERVDEIKQGMLQWLEKILVKVKNMSNKQQQQKTA